MLEQIRNGIVQLRAEAVVAPEVGEGADNGLFGTVDDVFEG